MAVPSANPDLRANPDLLRKILHELSFRQKKAARALYLEIAGRLGLSSITPAPSPVVVIGLQRGDAEAPTVVRGPPRRRANPTPLKFSPTTEQSAAVDAFMAGGSLKVTAFAGAGKTSTLKLMTREREGRGLYLAFNRSVAAEVAASFGEGVDCRTTHAIASRFVNGAYKFRRQKMFDDIGPVQLAGELGLKPRSVLARVRLERLDDLPSEKVEGARLALAESFHKLFARGWSPPQKAHRASPDAI